VPRTTDFLMMRRRRCCAFHTVLGGPEVTRPIEQRYRPEGGASDRACRIFFRSRSFSSFEHRDKNLHLSSTPPLTHITSPPLPSPFLPHPFLPHRFTSCISGLTLYLLSDLISTLAANPYFHAMPLLRRRRRSYCRAQAALQLPFFLFFFFLIRTVGTSTGQSETDCFVVVRGRVVELSKRALSSSWIGFGRLPCAFPRHCFENVLGTREPRDREARFPLIRRNDGGASAIFVSGFSRPEGRTNIAGEFVLPGERRLLFVEPRLFPSRRGQSQPDRPRWFISCAMARSTDVGPHGAATIVAFAQKSGCLAAAVGGLFVRLFAH